MTIVTRGQGVGLDSPDEASDLPTVQQTPTHNPPVNANLSGSPYNTVEYESHLSDQTSNETTGGQKDENVNTSCSCGSPKSCTSENSSEYASYKPDPHFPQEHLASLEDKINNPRWVIPVLPEQELEILLDAAIELCRAGKDGKSEACQRFFRDSMPVCINKIMTDEAVGGWKYNIHQCIYTNCLRFLEICALKITEDWLPLLDLLALVFNPCNKFHTLNAMRPSETIQLGSSYPDDYLFARPSVDSRTPRGWLVDMLNKFGEYGGFQSLLARFQSGKPLSIPVVYSLIKPFGFCYDLLTVHTIVTYFLPVVEMIPSILENLSDEELKREVKNESKNDAISTVIRSCRCLLSRVPNQEEKMKEFEMFRLKMLLRLLQISSFNGKMNALNEVNKLITGITYYPNRHGSIEHDSDEWLTSERMAKWIKENNVLEIVLRDSLHQPQYVEKLEKILRFIIKEKALTLEDLDAVWAAQAGKHDAIVKNVHDLLAKLAWDFSPEQLDHLFSCFQASWSTANKKQTEKLLELIRRLAEDDKDGVMAHKVLTLFWNLAHKEDVLPEILDQALSAHVKILDYSCSQERDAQKRFWIDKCVEELKSGSNWVLPALKLIKDICSLYEPLPNISHTQRPHVFYRQEIIERLQQQYSLVVLVSENLASYIESVREVVKEHPDINPNTYFPDKRYNHVQQVQERLGFLRFLLKDGRLWLCNEQARLIWECLAEKNVFDCDREACFKWFSKIMGEVPDLDPDIYKDFFENNVLQFDPAQLTESGMRCFERFFKIVNSKEGKLRLKRRDYQTDDIDLIGTDYLWRVLASGSDVIANRAIELLKEVNTNLGPRLQPSVCDFHDTHISECINRLRAHYDTISILCKQDNTCSQMNDSTSQVKTQIRKESVKMCRVLKVLYEYINECDNNFTSERKLLPLYRASKGKHISMIIRFLNTGRQIEDIDMVIHSNLTVGCLRKQILQKVKGFAANLKLELYANAEILDPIDDRRLISEVPAIKDKMLLTVKLVQGSGNLVSSPDSSSDSSTGSPHHTLDSSPNEDEIFLPGVIISRNEKYTQFFFQIADRGCELNDSNLRDAARNILQIIPPDQTTVRNLFSLFCNTDSEPSEEMSEVPTVDSLFFGTSPSQVLYNIEVLYTLLMPSYDPANKIVISFQYTFLCSDECQVALEMLTKNNFLPKADVATKRAAFVTVLKICNVLLSIVGHIMYRMADSTRNFLFDVTSQSDENYTISSALSLIKEAFYSLPHQSADSAMRSVLACKVAEKFIDEVILTNQVDFHSTIINEALGFNIPHLETIRAIMRLVWACAGGNMQLIIDSANTETLHKSLKDNDPDDSDVAVCREALELLTICVILNRHALEALYNDKLWPHFIIDLVLLANNRAIRYYAGEQIYLMMSYSHTQAPLLNCVSLLFNVLNDNMVTENGSNTYEYFRLLWRLLGAIQQHDYPIQNIEILLDSEITWLKNVKENVKKCGILLVDEILLEGHIGITKELLKYMSPDKKFYYGSDESTSINLVKELIEDFIFPASKLMVHLEKTKEPILEKAVPVCNSPQTLESAFDLLVTLCVGCPQNLKLVVDMLCDMFYSERDSPLIEWDYLPPVGPRPTTGFVGLKNAGATCYMNSVLQQLYMVESIRVNILAAEGAATDPNEDFSGEDRFDLDSPVDTVDNDEKGCVDEARKKYNINILKEVQAIFGHLAYSKLQYYVPKGLWRNFRLQGEPVNLREQQDAVEFFMSLIESIDEALKALNHEQTMSKILGGSFSDQKICKGCPHRYCREEPFSVISVDMRNHSNLLDSLEQYVKGELLEGVDAYYCDKCDKKVETVKRLCVKKLPPVLTIQLKRFEYDFERVCAIKFNDYFEFPRNLDMEPYTVSGLAKLEGELIDCDTISPDGSSEVFVNNGEMCTKYQLTGIVVHSGQASGGHYYSYILHRHSNGTTKWYKFDDGDVSECKMEDDEEMKSQCFGGDYMGEVFDQMLKRMSYRRQKRWWNAYMLFYTRLDVQENSLVNNLKNLSLTDSRQSNLVMPEPIEKSVMRQNIKFMHNRNQFSQEYFHFMKRLSICNTPGQSQYAFEALPNSTLEELSVLTVLLISKFLFHTGFHTKKALRGPASEWYEVLSFHLKNYRSVRKWFTCNILLNHPHRFCEYLLTCPSTEVRVAFTKIVAHLAHYLLNDPAPTAMSTPSIFFETTSPLSDQILVSILALLNKEVSDHVRHLSHYFSLFHIYCGFGPAERGQLLRLNVPCLFMLVTLDEGPGPAIKYQYQELNKCHTVISTLVRSCNVRHNCTTFQSAEYKPNPFAEYSGDNYIMDIQPQVQEILYNRISYIKKLIEEVQLTEDTLKLLQFISWENPLISKSILSEVLWQIEFAYCNELKHHIELLLALLRMEDSWQDHRITNALRGIPEERNGLFDIAFNNKAHYQKRTYQCIKCMVLLFSKCQAAYNQLNQLEMKKKWLQAVEWLNEELERKQYVSSPPYVNYGNWQSTGSIPSNDTTNGYFLERSNSARKTLEKALEMCPELTMGEVDADDLGSDDGESSQTEELNPNEIHQPVSSVAVVYPQRVHFKTGITRLVDIEVPANEMRNTSTPQRPYLTEKNVSDARHQQGAHQSSSEELPIFNDMPKRCVKKNIGILSNVKGKGSLAAKANTVQNPSSTDSS